MDTRYNDNARPIGYYSNEDNNGQNQGTNRGRNGYEVTDNDGPLTEIMDRTVGDNDNNNNNQGNNRTNNRNNRTNNNRDFGALGTDRERTNNDNRYTTNNKYMSGDRYGSNRQGVVNDNNRGFGALGTDNRTNNGNDLNPFNDGKDTLKNNTHGKSDTNYHGHLNDTNNRARSSAYNNNNNYNGDLVNKIVDRVEKVKNVDDARAVIMKNDVIIAIDTNDKNDRNVQNEVKNAVESLTKGKDVRVVTDEGTYSRVRDLDNNIRNGVTPDTIDADMNDLFENVGETIRRPFQNNNR
jgi:spore cortex protein